MIKQKFIGSLTFICGFMILSTWITFYFRNDLPFLFSEKPLDTFLVIYGILIDGFLGLACGILLFKGIKAGYLLAFIVWGGAILLPICNLCLFSVGSDMEHYGIVDDSDIYLDIAIIMINVYVIKILYSDFKKGPDEVQKIPSVTLS